MTQPQDPPAGEAERHADRLRALDRMSMDYPVEFDVPPEAADEQPTG